MTARLQVGDCLPHLERMPENSIDSGVLDPPYGLSAPADVAEVLRHWVPEDRRAAEALTRLWRLRRQLQGSAAWPSARRDLDASIRAIAGHLRQAREAYRHGSPGFMGHAWDSFVPGPRVFRQLWRVLKPGGHALVFAGTRTEHLMALSAQLAGFEVRDVIHWAYWQGMIKSHNVEKAIDKRRHDRAEVLQVTAWIREARNAAGIRNADIDNAFGFAGMAGHWTSSKSQPSVPTLDQVPVLLQVLGSPVVPPEIQRLLVDLNTAKGQPGKAWEQREVVGTGGESGGPTARMTLLGDHGFKPEYAITAPGSPEAAEWAGWGTTLKPAVEPAILLRKPLAEKTVAANVLKWGTGAINLDACRFKQGDPMWLGPQETEARTNSRRVDSQIFGKFGPTEGHQTKGQKLGRAPANLLYCPKPSRVERELGCEGLPYRLVEGEPPPGRRNWHPTVKPLRLCRWMVRLVTPPGGKVVDPFTGSGVTGMSAVGQGFDFEGMELVPDHAQIGRARIEWAQNGAEVECDLPDIRTPPAQPGLF